MYKFLSGFLFVVLVVAISVGGYKVWRSEKENTRLSNELARSQKTEQETKSAYSTAGQKLSDLEATNKELQKKIDNRDEEVAALGQVNVKLKDQLFKIQNATQTEVENEPGRIRIDFEKEQDLWRVKGYCLTSPPESEVLVSWSRSLELSFLLTKKNGQYRLYLDSNSPDVIAIQNLSLRVDPSVFERKWYEKIAVGFDLGFTGKEPVASVRGTFDIGSLSPGAFMTLFNGKEGLERAYGVSLMWRPF